MFKQVRALPSHVKERAYPKQVAQESNVEGYGELKIRMDETIFAAYDNVEMRKAKNLVAANSDFAYTSKSLFWPGLIDLDLQSVSVANGV